MNDRTQSTNEDLPDPDDTHDLGVMNDPDDPKELSTQADDEAPLTRQEAEVAGMLPDEPVYGDDSINPNAEDRLDAERGA